MNRKVRIFMLAALVLTLAACAAPKETPQQELAPSEYDAWCVYWDEESAAAANQDADIRTLILFACIYREDGSIYIPPQLETLHSSLSNRQGSMYLSFVNDVWHDGGPAVQKSTDLLSLLLASPESREQCAEGMADLAEGWGCTGFEIDFENMARGKGLWEPYLEFIKTAWQVAERRNLGCRVVLGSGFPTDQYELPEGPEYSVMCYNLYGTHSGPGPKADLAFLRKTAKKFGSIPGIRFALANGGFLWNQDGVIRSLTTWEAELLAEQKNATVKRDSDSGALVFSFRENGEKRTVWYADAQTLSLWRGALSNSLESEAQTDLWRIE